MTMPFYVAPEQMMKDRADYARKGIAKGRSLIGFRYDDGIAIVAENTSASLRKVSEIYDRIAFAGVGKYNEFESLRVAGIRYADVKGYQYGRADVTAKSLASAFSQTLGNIFVQGVKPYEVEILIAEVGLSAARDGLYRVTYDGTLYDDQGVAAIGGQAEALLEKLGEGYQPGMPMTEALSMAAAAFREVQEREAEGWEGALLDRGGSHRRFRRLAAEELSKI